MKMLELRKIENVGFGWERSKEYAEEVLDHSMLLENDSIDIVNDVPFCTSNHLEEPNVTVYKIREVQGLKELLLDTHEGTYNPTLKNLIGNMTEDQIISNQIPEELKDIAGLSSPKLTKALTKLGKENSEIVRVYTTLVNDYRDGKKTGKTGLLILSGLPHHKAGISFYGHGWSSCQDTNGSNGDEHYINHLPAFMMENSMVAFTDFSGRSVRDTLHEPEYYSRSIVRFFDGVHLNGTSKQTHFYCKRYGDSMKDKQILEQGLQQLGMYDIDNTHQFRGEQVSIIKRATPYHANTECTHCDSDGEIHVREEYEREVVCECPACDNDGEIEIETEAGDYRHVTCPQCRGTQEIEYPVMVEVDEYVTCPVCDGDKHGDNVEPYTAYDGDDMNIRFTVSGTVFLVPHGLLVKEGYQRDGEDEEVRENDITTELMDVLGL